jgi:non-ribosomal peptide synthetase component F
MGRNWRWLTVAASAACAPLNPAYGADELDRYFADLHPRALITQAGFNSSARCGGHHVALDLAIYLKDATADDLQPLADDLEVVSNDGFFTR